MLDMADVLCAAYRHHGKRMSAKLRDSLIEAVELTNACAREAAAEQPERAGPHWRIDWEEMARLRDHGIDGFVVINVSGHGEQIRFDEAGILTNWGDHRTPKDKEAIANE